MTYLGNINHTRTVIGNLNNSTFEELVELTTTTNRTVEFYDVMLKFEHNPVVVGVACACIFVLVMCLFLWSYFRSAPQEAFEHSFSASVQQSPKKTIMDADEMKGSRSELLLQKLIIEE